MSEEPKELPTTKKEVHVTELAGPDDHWVSVTDASRIARRQEHTIRTWIAQGVLPVHPVRVGINKKTRQVRLSDLAQLTPIIDPDAGIATDLGTLDLPSIPRQQHLLAEQMTELQRETTRQFAALSEHFRRLMGEHETFAEKTRQTWGIHQQQYQALAHRDEELQRFLQQVRDTLEERLRELDRSLHQQLLDQGTSYSQELQQVRQDLSALVSETEKTLRQAVSDQVGHSEATLRQALEAVREASAEATEQVRQNIMGLEKHLASAVETHEELAATVSRQHAHSEQQFSQVSNRLEPLETALGKLQREIQKHGEHVDQQITEVFSQIGQFATQVTGLQSTWQELARASEQEVCQLRHDLDAQGRLQQTLQQQLDEEREAREALARQVNKLTRVLPAKRQGT